MYKVCIIAIACLLIVSCANSPEKETYVSEGLYSDYNCNQLRAQLDLNSSKLQQKTNRDTGTDFFDTALKAYAISQGYGFEESRDYELERLQNEHDVLNNLLIKKDCIK